MTADDWAAAKKKMPAKDFAELVAIFQHECWLDERRKLYALYPDEGPLRRELYPKHVKFFEAGNIHQERGFLGGNRTGKTTCVNYESTCHMTGWYPKWWAGRRFDRPVTWWFSGTDGKAVRESLQTGLLGPVNDLGTGLIPLEKIVGKPTARSGVPEAYDAFNVKHASGGTSRGLFKCFARGTDVKMANGELRAIEDVRLGDMVLCADGSAREVMETHAYRDAATRIIETRSGSITVTGNHSLFKAGGGRCEADHIKVGDVLEIASPSHGDGTPAEDWRVKITALMIGDGCSRGKTPFFTCVEPEIIQAAGECLPPSLKIVPIRNTISYKISSSEHKFNIVKHSLEADGLWGVLSKRKFIPRWVFKLPMDQKILFLRWLWGCDGTVQNGSATYVTASLRLARDMRLLMWDTGIYAAVKTHMVKLKGKTFQSHYITLTGQNRLRFCDIGKLNRDSSSTVTPAPNRPYGEVLSIAESRSDVFCVTVDTTHELIADGYRSGNSYDQGRESFQAAKIDGIVFDEEPPMAIYSEGMLRTMATDGKSKNGIVMCAFTPLKGRSAVYNLFMPGGRTLEEGRVAA